jgi:hypothetical protein
MQGRRPKDITGATVVWALAAAAVGYRKLMDGADSHDGGGGEDASVKGGSNRRNFLKRQTSVVGGSEFGRSKVSREGREQV